MQTLEIVMIVVAVAVLAGLGWVYYQHQRSRRLRTHFGPEYERTVYEAGSRRRAESILAEREAHLKKLEIRPLASSERDRFETEWKLCQSHFVNDPARAVREADSLVTEIMRTRGYPTGDTDERSGNISAAYPNVARSYREACETLVHYDQGNASTEDLRRAMISYRELFDELLGAEREELQRAS